MVQSATLASGSLAGGSKKGRLAATAKGQRTAKKVLHPLAVPREFRRISSAWWKHGVFGLPLSLSRSLIFEPALEGLFVDARLLDLFGDSILKLFNELGPIYGKAGQIILSRLSPPMHQVADSLRLTRLYHDWPALGFGEVAAILDREIPRWRTEFMVAAAPLGVASIAQVHAATGRDGRKWVIKIVKPLAKERLQETLQAAEQMIAWCQPFTVTQTAKKALKELTELCLGFRREIDLKQELATILRVKEGLRSKRQKVLLIPEVYREFCTSQVMTVERFEGVSLADIVAGKVELSSQARQKLAKSMLSELLVQVFELGLFHADPHAGNLILLESGAVGLFDWGLAGELGDNDRKVIANVLKAVIALDQEQLIDTLVQMGEESGRSVERSSVARELKGVVAMVKQGKEDPKHKASLQKMLEACLSAAARLGIPVPDGLLMMVKSLVTIEGLARGIDPSVSLARAATPVLFKAAKPGFKEFLALGKRFPALAKQLWSS